MLRIVWLVMQDLWQFVWSCFMPKGLTLPASLPSGKNINQVLIANTVAKLSQVPLDVDVGSITSVAQTSSLHEPSIMYVHKLAGTACLVSPLEDFDNVLNFFAYGTAVTVLSYQGQYARVFRTDNEGWVHKDDLTPAKSSVWPHFSSGVVYDFDHTETIKTRALLQDIFTLNNLQVPLQGGEYVLFRLRQDNRFVIWPPLRPRLPGLWHTYLRGVAGVHIAVTPKTDGVMEWTDDEGIGRVAYVEAVAPNLAVTVSLVGMEVAGEYTEVTFTESVWRELRPVFIEIQS